MWTSRTHSHQSTAFIWPQPAAALWFLKSVEIPDTLAVPFLKSQKHNTSSQPWKRMYCSCCVLVKTSISFSYIYYCCNFIDLKWPLFTGSQISSQEFRLFFDLSKHWKFRTLFKAILFVLYLRQVGGNNKAPQTPWHRQSQRLESLRSKPTNMWRLWRVPFLAGLLMCPHTAGRMSSGPSLLLRHQCLWSVRPVTVRPYPYGLI